jgi:hypothetical protein
MNGAIVHDSPYGLASFALLNFVVRARLGKSVRRYRFTGHAILAFNPLAKINKLTALGTKWTKRVVLPVDRIMAGWTLPHLDARKKRRESTL